MNSVFVSEFSIDELTEILSNRIDFQDTSYGPLRGVILLVGIGLLLLGDIRDAGTNLTRGASNDDLLDPFVLALTASSLTDKL
jgi:hypothetical protein